MLDLQFIQLTYFGIEIFFFLVGGLFYFVRGFSCACLAWLSEKWSSYVFLLIAILDKFCEDKGTRVV